MVKLVTFTVFEKIENLLENIFIQYNFYSIKKKGKIALNNHFKPLLSY